MAYTKSPMQDTHGVQRIPVQGTSFLVSNPGTTPLWTPTVNGYTNCFPISEPQWGTDPLRRVHKRQGWISRATQTGEVASTGALGAFTVQTYTLPRFFFSKADRIYALTYGIDVVTEATTTGTIGNYSLGWGTNAIDQTNTRKVAVLEQNGSTVTNLFLCNEDSTSPSVTNLNSIGVTGTKGLVFINGYLFAASADGNKIYNSDPAGNLTTWNSTNFLDAEQYADQILWIDKHKNYLVAFGQDSIEFFFDASIEVGSPLKRQESYSSRIGFYNSWVSPGGKMIANVEDDLYFIGLSQQKQLGLYRIRNFQIEELDNQFIQGMMNDTNLGISSIYPCNFNNNPHIVVAFTNSSPWAYFIKENIWWKITGNDFPPSDNVVIGKPVNSLNDDNAAQAPECYIITQSTTTSTLVRLTYGDISYSTAVSSDYRTEVIDFGNNRWKHIARVDVIGDFGTSTQVTLFYDGTPNYGVSSTTVTPGYIPSTIGYENNVSFYNLGAFRRFNFQVRMDGSSPCILEALEIEYNVGNA